MKEFINLIFSTDFVYSIFRVMTPLLFASMGAVISDIAGTPNIALEGLMLMAAFSGMYFSYLTQSALIGLVMALLTAVLFAGVLAFFTLYYKTNIILGGIALNSLASGGTVFLLYLAAKDKGTSVSLASKTLPNIHIPIIENIPVLGGIVSGHNISGISYPGCGRKESGCGVCGNQYNEDTGGCAAVKRGNVRIWRSIHVHGICVLVFQGHAEQPGMDCPGGRSNGAADSAWFSSGFLPVRSGRRGVKCGRGAGASV